jgi:hypothetical protein
MHNHAQGYSAHNASCRVAELGDLHNSQRVLVSVQNWHCLTSAFNRLARGELCQACAGLRDIRR